MKFIFTLIMLVFISASIFAGNDSIVKLYGFSKDGAYAAFIRNGFIDGKGDNFSEVHILNIKKNSYAASVVSVVLELEDKRKPEELALKKAQKYLNQLKISKDIQVQSFNLIIENPVLKIGKKNYTVGFNKIPTGKKCEFEELETHLLELYLESNGKKILLQKDKKVPPSRGICVFSYQPEIAFVYKNSVLILVLFNNPGFEGPDKNHIGITAKID